MDNIPAYIRRKHGQEPVTYLHPLLEPYLEKTYGIFVYQEDIMSAAIALGGFTGPEADTLGYAIRKKKSAVLRAQKEKFVTQAAERGVAPQDVIDAVFKAFEPFERYGFNKAHATCYGLIAYQTAYLKANYTVEYMTARPDRLPLERGEGRGGGRRVPPDGRSRSCRRTSTRSHLEFTVEGDAIRFGLLAVKNVGQGAIESIIAARDEGGAVPLADRLLHPDRPAAGQPQGARGAGQGRGAQRRSGTRPRSCSGSTTRSRAAQATQRDRITRPDLAVRPGRRRAAALRAPAAGRDRGARPRAPALGEGAARAVPLGAPDGRGRGAGRAVRDRLLGRPAATSRSTASGSSSAGS